MPTVGIITVAYNSLATLGPFLHSVRDDPMGAEAPVIVVDNGSDDPDAERELTESFGARWVVPGDNRGYGGGVNFGAARIPETDYLLISNPDILIGRGAIAALVAAAEASPGIGALGPLIREPDGSVYPSARSLPSLRTGIGHALLGRTQPDNRWSRRYREETRPPTSTRTAGWLSGSFLLLRRSVFDELGGFDESYFMYFEDVDLGARIGARGWTNVYEPSAEVVHLGGHSTSGQAGRMLIEHHRSAYRFLSRRYRAWYLAPLRLALRVGLGVRAWWLTRGEGVHPHAGAGRPDSDRSRS